MNKTIGFNRTIPDAPVQRLDRLYQSLVLRTLEKMNRGGLHIELPDESQRLIGTRGAEVTARIRIVRSDFFKRCVLFGDVGFGEAYVEGDWDTDDIAKVIAWFILNIEDEPSPSVVKSRKLFTNVLGAWNRLKHLLRRNTLSISRRNISEHYDLGNDFYSLWLDATMTYSSAYFTKATESLEEAQIAKYDLLCRKLKLNEKDHVLEIGSGWGGFSCYAASRYGCKVTATTISEEQFRYASARIREEGLEHRIDIKLQDYRHLTGKFDKIASIEMIEAVGDRYLETYFAKCNELLANNGLLGIQMITCPDSKYDTLRSGTDWIQRHIFPGSLLLSIGRVNQALNKTGNLFLHDLEDLGSSYVKTLQLWCDRFNAKLDQVHALGFDRRFVRKWNYYLRYCEAAFATRNISVVQTIFTRPNNPIL